MATGKKAQDIFQPTTGKKADIGKEVPERIEGRPRAAEPYQKACTNVKSYPRTRAPWQSGKGWGKRSAGRN
jgi:hypothetical protein